MPGLYAVFSFDYSFYLNTMTTMYSIQILNAFIAINSCYITTAICSVIANYCKTILFFQIYAPGDTNMSRSYDFIFIHTHTYVSAPTVLPEMYFPVILWMVYLLFLFVCFFFIIFLSFNRESDLFQ